MIIGCPKEIKVHEYRVGLTPSSASELIRNGHTVIMEKNAGNGIGISDSDYENVGCSILLKPDEIFKKAEMIVKVKEPQSAPRMCDARTTSPPLYISSFSCR